MPFVKGKAANPTGKGGYRKGQTGNPGGRPKDMAEFKRLVQERLEEKALQVLERNLEDFDGGVSNRALETVLAYSRGRPTQAVEVSGPEGGPMRVEDVRSRLLERIDRLAAKVGAGQSNSQSKRD